jgi:hypothetical protein
MSYDNNSFMRGRVLFLFLIQPNIYIKGEGGVQKLATESQSDSPHPQLHAEEIYKI